jgi:hypothetical protein
LSGRYNYNCNKGISDTYNITVQNNIAYCSLYDMGVDLVDVSQASSPKLISQYNFSGYASKIQYNGNYIYLGDTSGGIKTIDVTNPASPVKVSAISSYYDIEDLYADGAGNLYAADTRDFMIYNIVNPAAPSLFSRTSTGTSYALSGIKSSGNYTFVTDEYNGLLIYNTASKYLPTYISGYDTSGYAMNVVVNGNKAYIADYDKGLVILDISNINSPALINSIATDGWAYNLFINGSYAYLADINPGTANGLRVIDMTDLMNLKISGGYTTANSAYNLAVNSDIGYVAAGSLYIFDASNKQSPVKINEYAASAVSVAFNGDYVYVANGSSENAMLVLKVTKH